MKKIALSIFIVLLFSFAAFATDFEQVTLANNAVSTLTAAKYHHAGAFQQDAIEAFCTLTVGSINYTTNGTTPTTTTGGVGHTMTTSDKLILTGPDIAAFQGIATTAVAPILSCSYYFQVDSIGFK